MGGGGRAGGGGGRRGGGGGGGRGGGGGGGRAGGVEKRQKTEKVLILFGVYRRQTQALRARNCCVQLQGNMLCLCRSSIGNISCGLG